MQPDKEIHDLVINAFGEWNYVTKKVKRMMYWMPKLKHSNTYLDRRKIEGKKLDAVDLGYLALKMISRDPSTQITLVGVGLSTFVIYNYIIFFYYFVVICSS